MATIKLSNGTTFEGTVVECIAFKNAMESKGSKGSAPDGTIKDKDKDKVKVKGIEDFAPKKGCAYGQWKYAFHKFVAATIDGFTLSRDVRNGKVSYHLYYKDGKYAELPEYIAAKELWNKTYPYDEYVKTK